MSTINRSKIMNNSKVKKEIYGFQIAIEKNNKLKEEIENEDVDDVFDEALQRKIKHDPGSLDEQSYANSTTSTKSNINYCKGNTKFCSTDRIHENYLDAKKLVAEETEHIFDETKDDLSIQCLTEDKIELDISCEKINEKLYAVDEENGTYFPITVFHNKKLAGSCNANEKVYVIGTIGENDMLDNSSKDKVCKYKIINTFKNSCKSDENVYVIDTDKPAIVKYLESVKQPSANNYSYSNQLRAVECVNGSGTGNRDDICIISDDENNSLDSVKCLEGESSNSVITVESSKEVINKIIDDSDKKFTVLPTTTSVVEDTDDIFDEENEKREKDLLKNLKLYNRFEAEGSEKIENCLQQKSSRSTGEGSNKPLYENNDKSQNNVNSMEADEQKSRTKSCNVNPEMGNSNAGKCSKDEKGLESRNRVTDNYALFEKSNLQNRTIEEMSSDTTTQEIELKVTVTATARAITKIKSKPQNKNNKGHSCLKTSKQKTVSKNNTGLEVTSNASNKSSAKSQNREKSKENNLKIGKQSNADKRNKDIECNSLQYYNIQNKGSIRDQISFKSPEKTRNEGRENKVSKTSQIRPKSARITQKTKCICACNNVTEGKNTKQKKHYPKANVYESDKKVKSSEKLETNVYSSLHSGKNKAETEHSSRNHEIDKSHENNIVVTSNLFEKFYEDIIKNKLQFGNGANMDTGNQNRDRVQSINMVNHESMNETEEGEIRSLMSNTETEELQEAKQLKKNMRTYKLQTSSEDLFKTGNKTTDLSSNSNLLKQNKMGNCQDVKRDEECLSIDKKNYIPENENVLKGENQGLNVNEAIKLINGILTKIADSEMTDKTINTLIENIENTVKKQNSSISENTKIVNFPEKLSTQGDINSKGFSKRDIKIEKGLNKHDTNNSPQSGNQIILLKNDAQEIDEFNKIDSMNCDKISQNFEQTKYSSNAGERKTIKSKRKAIVNYNPNKKVKLESNMPPYSCTECPYQSYNKKNFNNHTIIHSKVVIKCDFCNYFTNRQRNLVAHMKVHLVANEVKMFKCPDCSYRTKRKDRLKMHLANKRQQNTKMFQENMKMFKCDECPYYSKRKSNLKRHQACHKVNWSY